MICSSWTRPGGQAGADQLHLKFYSAELCWRLYWGWTAMLFPWNLNIDWDLHFWKLDGYPFFHSVGTSFFSKIFMKSGFKHLHGYIDVHFLCLCQDVIWSCCFAVFELYDCFLYFLRRHSTDYREANTLSTETQLLQKRQTIWWWYILHVTYWGWEYFSWKICTD